MLAIADYANKETGDAFPSIKSLAKDSLMSERSVQRAIRRFVIEKRLTITPGGGRKSNFYRILTPVNLSPLERQIDTAPPSPDVTPGVTPTVTLTVIEPPSNQKKNADAILVVKNRVSTETIERSREREQFKKMWIALCREVRRVEYTVLPCEFVSLRDLINTGKGPQGLINMARDAWAHPEFGWNCANLKSLTNFAKRFHEIEDELTQRKNASQRSSKPRTDGNSGTANDGTADQYRNCGA